MYALGLSSHKGEARKLMFELGDFRTQMVTNVPQDFNKFSEFCEIANFVLTALYLRPLVPNVLKNKKSCIILHRNSMIKMFNIFCRPPN